MAGVPLSIEKYFRETTSHPQEFLKAPMYVLLEFGIVLHWAPIDS